MSLAVVVTQGIDFIPVIFFRLLLYHFIVIKFLWLSGGQEAIRYTNSESNFNCPPTLTCIMYAKQKHLGCKKSAGPIRSNMQAGRCDQKL